MYLLYCLRLFAVGLCIGLVKCQEDDNEHCDCAAGTFSVNGDCYSINENMSTYADADIHCQGLGGNLVKFEPSENATEFLKLISSDLSDVWIGLDDRDEEGLFRWIVDGSELNWNMSNFRSENEDDLDCIGMDSSGDFQFFNCDAEHAAICDLRVCSDGTCDCYQRVSAKNPIDLYSGERCILTLLTRPPNSFLDQEEICAKLGFGLNNGADGSLAMFHPWYDIKNIVLEQIQSFPKDRFFWIGLSDIEVEGQIKFIHGDLNILNDTDIDFNAANIEAVDCVSINTKSGLWNYAACSKTLPFICQTDPKCGDSSESYVVMVSMVAGVVGSSLTVLVVILVICIILKYFKASLKRFGRYKMSTVHETPYTEVEVQNGNDIEPSNSFINRPRNHRPLSLVESTHVIRDDNEHFYEDSDFTGETQPGKMKGLPSIYNGGDSLTYEDVGSSTDNHVEGLDKRQALRTANESDVKNNKREIAFESRSSKIVLLKDDALQNDSDTGTEGGLSNLNDGYYEIDSNIYHEVNEMKTITDDSYYDVTVEEEEVDTPEMTNNFYDGSGVSENGTLDMVYNDSYDHGNFEGNTAEDYDEI